jgi:hypothetical protein
LNNEQSVQDTTFTAKHQPPQRKPLQHGLVHAMYDSISESSGGPLGIKCGILARTTDESASVRAKAEHKRAEEKEKKKEKEGGSHRCRSGLLVRS